MVADAISKRVDNVLLDYTAQGCTMKYQIDGMWHDLPPREVLIAEAVCPVSVTGRSCRDTLPRACR